MSIFDEKQCAELAKTLTAMCVRNAEIENIHAGKAPLSKTGDYSDVKIIDAEGNEFAWPDVSHISDEEMKIVRCQSILLIEHINIRCASLSTLSGN